MTLKAEQGGGWKIVRGAAHLGYDGVELVGYHDHAGQGLDMRVLPEPGVTIVLVLDGELRVDQARPVPVGIASGIGVSSTRVHGTDLACVDIHLSPLTAHAVLDGAIAELAGTVVGFEELWGAEAHRLRDELVSTDRWDARFSVLRAALAEKLHVNRSVDREVAFVWRELVASGGQRRISDLATEAGWSRKRLWARFAAQLGVTPKRAAMIVRLSPAIDAITAGTPLADVAARYGYADQSHLTRDLKELSGFTPASLYRDWNDAGTGEGTIVQDAAR